MSLRSIALLDYDGNLVTMQLSNGEVTAVAQGVESVVDLTVITSEGRVASRRPCGWRTRP